tara:strand:- start:504 stop:2120 length:1617 start_codon:yes stop_codon:yes gene_type:complete
VRFLIFIAIFILTHVSLESENYESGGILSLEQGSIDVGHYTLDIKIDPYKKVISGSVDIEFQLLKKTNKIVIDLINDYSLSGAIINGMSLAYIHKENKIFIDNPGLELFKKNLLSIKYGGRPPVAENPPWDGGFTWSKSKDGKDWVGVSCQTNGANIWFPCKEHPSDKSNGADIFITVPPSLMAVSNGLLQSQKTLKDRWVRWHWKTEYPISTYNINITVGAFEVIEKTGYILDKPLKMVYYVLPEKKDGGRALLDEAEEYLNFYAESFGQYPWINEKFGLVHTPYLGMEHQTINAYGNKYKKTKRGYDFILFHEAGHEWWGNYLSVADWSDFWIHEGFDTYAECMYIEQKFGLESAKNFIDERYKKNIVNKGPVVPDRNSTAKHNSGNDVYYKGAHILHMLRYLIGRDVLWETLKEYIAMPKELPDNQTSTKEFISLINENTERDLGWFFNQYLYLKDLPTLCRFEKTVKDKRFVDLWWEEDGFKMPIEVHYFSFDGRREKKLNLNNERRRIVVPANSKLIIDPERWLLFKEKTKRQ